ncbi:MAG: hypothetical protein WAP52_02540, partial [Candidatus Sungiibacteriota bacterium]
MTPQKKSDGIRKKSEPRAVSHEMMRDNLPAARDALIRDESQERGSALKAVAFEREMPQEIFSPDDNKPIQKSEFLDHWRLSQKDHNNEFQRGYNGTDAGDRVIYDTEKIPRAAAQERWLSKTPIRFARWGMIAGGIVVAAMIIFISTRGAYITISFKPRIDDVVLQDIAVAFDISVAKVLVPQKVIPAEALSFLKKREQSFSATGKKQIAERARGKAVIVNSFSSSPQTLVAGTRFLT